MRRRLAAVGLMVAALLGLNAAPAPAAQHGFRLIFADGFNQRTPLGSFSGCDHNDDTPQVYRSGLTGSMRANWWAYPAGWPDTATQRGYPVGGYYDPVTTLWVVPSPWGDGQSHIRMWRGSSGPVHSATVVPKAAMGLKYGAYQERWRVSHVAKGYKSAHLLWPVSNSDQCSENDFPESEGDTQVAGFMHPSNYGEQVAVDTGQSWGRWHFLLRFTEGNVPDLSDALDTGRGRWEPAAEQPDLRNRARRGWVAVAVNRNFVHPVG
ncbi:glycosyl hydrolase family 16 [Streptantibioticus rubrisoli]|uniref:Glycosyl hydrolase family 16 n=1 Tax=Streptantibioticus rubrisoli TaxID=1387313 RepID=A0ABT1P5H4_9ACTN|nr:glycosyl hydrolase family 16 [Streptantibioticus rubrisoli]MCQ4040614.1 glycosyl hydrolase family 16 [Streptantibioticus rubrisoli]